MNKASKESASSLKDLKEMGERYLLNRKADMTCIKVMPLYGYLEHKRLALLDLNPAVRDNRLILRVNFSFHAPRDAASGGQSARHRHQPASDAVLFAE